MSNRKIFIILISIASPLCTSTLHPISYTPFCTPYRLHSIPYPLPPTVHPLHLILYTLSPTLYSLHPIPYTLFPTPCPLHPVPYTLSPTPHPLHPIPYILCYTPCPIHTTLAAGVGRMHRTPCSRQKWAIRRWRSCLDPFPRSGCRAWSWQRNLLLTWGLQEQGTTLWGSGPGLPCSETDLAGGAYGSNTIIKKMGCNIDARTFTRRFAFCNPSIIFIWILK